jgi:hypothetical protein
MLTILNSTSFFAFAIDPTPAGRKDVLDNEGNLVTQARFEGSTATLTITSRFTLETTRQNAFDWLAREDRIHKMGLVTFYRCGVELASKVLTQPPGDLHHFFERALEGEPDGNGLTAIVCRRRRG